MRVPRTLLGVEVALLALLVIPQVPVKAVLRTNATFTPAGPFREALQYKYYAGSSAEFQAFVNGELDLTDSPLTPDLVPDFLANPDIAVTPPMTGLDMFHIDINMQGSKWSAWGCNFQHGNSRCGREIRQAERRRR